MEKFKISTIITIFVYIVSLIFFSSCRGEELEHKIILSKSNESFFNKPLSDGWCRFFYQRYENSEWVEFKDKCEKYNVGDTIVGTYRNYD